MPSSPLSGRQRDALLQHLDSLFGLAQVVSPNPQEAVALVEATFRRAFSASVPPSEPAEHGGDHQLRTWLFRLMMQVRNEQVRNEQVSERADETADDSAGGGAADAATDRRGDLADFQRRLSEEFVDRILPSAFAALPSDQRVLLMLCDVEQMDCNDAARVVAVDPAVSCARLDEAHASLRREIFDQATGAERTMLGSGLPADWQHEALLRMADSRLVVVPPTLRPSVASIFKSMSPASRSDDREEDVGVHGDAHALTRGSSFGMAKKFLAVLTIIAVAGLLGYAFTYFTRHEPNVNLISLSAQQASSVEASFQTTSAEQAERYIYDRLGSRVTLPTIADASLQGVSIRPVADGAEVPVLLFKDPSSSRPIAVYVYSYAFLDRHQNSLVLERDILRQIEAEGNFDLHDLGEEKALVWRSRDDIFVAITSGDADALRDRIAHPS